MRDTLIRILFDEAFVPAASAPRVADTVMERLKMKVEYDSGGFKYDTKPHGVIYPVTYRYSTGWLPADKEDNE